MAAAAAVMADQTLESRVARLESDVSHIRADIAEIKLDMRALRTEISGLHTELHGLGTALRGELHAAVAQLDRRLTRGLASNRVWMLLQSAAVLGVMARGFKWL